MIKNMKDLKYGGNMYIILIYDIKQVDDFAKVQRKFIKFAKDIYIMFKIQYLKENYQNRNQKK